MTRKFPLRPPDYFDSADQPHEQGIILTDPPVCDRCIASPSSITKLEQHAAVLREDRQTPQRSSIDVITRNTAQRAAQMSNSRAILQDPLPKIQKHRPIPAWMSLLPSNVHAHIQPPSHSTMSRRTSFPSYSSSSNPTFYMASLEWPISHDDYTANPLPTPAHLSLDGDTESGAPDLRKRHSSTELAILLRQTQLFSLQNATWPPAIPSQLLKNTGLVQSPVIDHPNLHGAILDTTYSSLRTPYSASLRRSQRSTSRIDPSQVQLTAQDEHLPVQDPECPSRPPRDLHTSSPFALRPCASSSEKSISNLYRNVPTAPRTKQQPSAAGSPKILLSLHEGCFQPQQITMQERIPKHDEWEPATQPQFPPQAHSRAATRQHTGLPINSTTPPFLKELSAFLAKGSRDGSATRGLRTGVAASGRGREVGDCAEDRLT